MNNIHEWGNFPIVNNLEEIRGLLNKTSQLYHSHSSGGEDLAAKLNTIQLDIIKDDDEAVICYSDNDCKRGLRCVDFRCAKTSEAGEGPQTEDSMRPSESSKPVKISRPGEELEITETPTVKPKAMPEAPRISQGTAEEPVKETPIQKLVVKKPVCDRFDVVVKESSEGLSISLDTDLPDYTDLVVSVSRNYRSTKDTEAYSQEYLSEISTVGKWRGVHAVPIDDEEWKGEIESLRQLFASVGEGFAVDSVSNDVDIRLVVPVNQKHPSFGEMNEYLSGKMVNRGGLRIVEFETSISRPLGQYRAAAWVSAESLQKEKMYRLKKRNPKIQHPSMAEGTPLMPVLDPGGDVSQFEKIRHIPEPFQVRIKGVTLNLGSKWYQVEAYKPDGSYFGKGWINSVALSDMAMEELKE